MIQIKLCPLCGYSEFRKKIDCADHFLTKEQFEILECLNCGLLFTNPAPSKDEMPGFYKSENYDSHQIDTSTLTGFVYSKVREFKIRNKYHLIQKLTTQKSILDYGCGTGDFLKFMKFKGYQTYGIEPAESARKFARDINHISVGDLHDFENLKSGSFGVVTLWHVLEHVYNLTQTLEKLNDILSDNGLLIIAVPNPASDDALYYSHFWAAYDVPRHLYHFTPRVLKEALKRAGFEPIKFTPMLFDSYYISLLSGKYASGRQDYFNAIIRGTLSNFKAWNKTGNYSSYNIAFRKIQPMK